MEYIISEKDDINRYFNEITECMDKYLKGYDGDFYRNYIYEEKINNRWLIRVPGCTVGCIEVDDNDIIYNIKLYNDTIRWYDKEVLNEIDKFYNMKLIME